MGGGRNALLELIFGETTNKNFQTFAAFTLAEVLITLGIIGVVAAITLPNLISNHQKQVTLARLKKAYTTFSNGIRLSEVDNGFFSEWEEGASIETFSYWSKYFEPYFVGAKLCISHSDCGYPSDMQKSGWTQYQWHLKTDNSRLLFMLKDGTVVFYPRNSSKTYEDGTKILIYSSDVYIDINGSKPPNKYCKDVFQFRRNKTVSGIKPLTCAKEIIENGWQFPENYSY